MKGEIMNVLSLFDGMSCGQIALERAGIEVNNYYAAEVDKYAIKVTQANYPNTKQLGDVTKWKEWDIDWSSIDLLIGGSPCQGFSVSGNHLAFDDPRSKLFFVYVDILNHIKSFRPRVKFLLENVKMKREYLDVISNHLKCYPVCLNSSLVSAQNRSRYYWSNIEYLSLRDKGIFMRDIWLGGEDITERVLSKKEGTSTHRNTWNNMLTLGDKSRCLTAAGQTIKNASCTNVRIGDKYFKLTPIECERLQTVPDNYTNHVSNTQRYKMLGNGWTVDVIAHIFKSIKGDL